MGEPKDQSYGARVGTVKDPFDNVWDISTQIAEKDKTQPNWKGALWPAQNCFA